MIRPEDLRIGDLVRVRKGYVFTEDEICKVVATESCSLGKKMEGGCITLKGLSWGEFTVGYCKNYKEIDPIPLAPEIFDKNDFTEEVVGEYYTKPLDNETHPIARYLAVEQKRENWCVFIKYRIFHDCALLRKIQHVHELQHILWALGLEANLKI